MPSESRIVRPHLLPDLSGPAHLAHLIRAYKGTYGFGELSKTIASRCQVAAWNGETCVQFITADPTGQAWVTLRLALSCVSSSMVWLGRSLKYESGITNL